MGIDGGFGVVSWNEDDDGIGLVDFGLLYDVFFERSCTLQTRDSVALFIRQWEKALGSGAR